MNKILAISIILIFYSLFNSCKVLKKSNEKSIYQETIHKPLFKFFTITNLYDSIITNYLKIDTISIKFNCLVTYNDTFNTKFNGILKLLRDKMIWLSVNGPLNIEVFRILLLTDSLYIYNKLTNEVLCNNIFNLAQKYDILLSFYDIQSILLNEIFLIQEPDIEKNIYNNPEYNKNTEKEFIKKNFFRSQKKDTLENYIILSSYRKNKLKKITMKKKTQSNFILQDFKINKNFKIISSEIYDLSSKRILKLNYSNFKKIFNSYFPHNLHIEMQDSINTIKCKIDYTKVNKTDKINASFNKKCIN